MSKLAYRMDTFSESQTLAMAKKCRELQAQGIDVISLSIGEPDFDTPDFIKDAAKDALDKGFTKYTPVPGMLDLRKAISTKFKRDNQLEYKPEQIVVSTGAKQSIANAVLCLINPGDEVIIPTPTWVSYVEIVKLAEGIPVFINTLIEDEFKFTAEDLKKVVSPKTKMLIFSSPCNPTGSVYNIDELTKIADVVAANENMFVISDEIYEHINFGEKHISIATIDKVKEQVITINGVSKGFAMTGWRIGYIGAPLWIAQACEKMQGQFTSGACSIAQIAAMAAVLADPACTIPMRDVFQKRRDLVVGLLREIPGIKANLPQGAFYVFPEISSFFGKRYGDTVINNSNDLCTFLLNHAHVALVSGDAFGNDDYLRISYATSEDKLVESLKRMKTALAELK